MSKHLRRRIKNIVEDNQLAYTPESVSGGMGNKVTSDHGEGYGGDYLGPMPAAGMHATVKNVQKPIEKIHAFLDKQEERIYLRPGEQAPQGAQVKTGERGADYYVPTQRTQPVEQPAPALAEAQQEQQEQQQLRAANGAPIPPAWTGVWVNPDPKAGLLAFGRDSKGRRVPLFSAEHRKQSHEQIFATLKALQPFMPMLQERLGSEKDLNDEAAVLYLITKIGFRIGSTKNTKAEQQAYGASTLLGKHVQVDGDIVTFDFIGKEGVLQHHTIEDADLAKLMKKHKKEDEERLFKTNGEKTNAYLMGATGKPFNNKDLRTWFATDNAIKFMREMPLPKNKKEYQKQRKEVGTKVAELLGNSPSEALESYISPEVFAGWEYPEENTEIQKSDDMNMNNLFEQVAYDEEIDWTKYNRDRVDDEKDSADEKDEWYNLNEDVEKSKVYLQGGAQPPSGKIVHTGKLGGKYYDTSEGKYFGAPSIAHASEHSPERIDDKAPDQKLDFELAREEIKKIFTETVMGKANRVTGRDDWTLDDHRAMAHMRTALHGYMRDLHPEILGSSPDAIRYAWQDGELEYEDCFRAVALFNVAAMMDRGMTYKQAKKVYQAVGPKAVLGFYKLDKVFDDYFNSEKKLYDEHKAVIKEVFGSGKIKVYRGCNGDFLGHRKVKAGESIELDETIPLSRWTLSKSMADSFAMNKHTMKKNACILEAEVDIDDIWYIGPLFSGSWDYEFEVDIDHSRIKPKVVAVYEVKYG